MRKHISKITAVFILASSAVAFGSVAFARSIVLKAYINMVGTGYCLPVPTMFAVKLTSTVSLSVIFIILMFTLGISEYFIKQERQRFIIQIGSVTVLMLFFAFLMLACVLLVYIPEITIAG